MASSRTAGAAVRERLLRAAGELIAERGWGAVSTRTVAARAGVGPGLVHYHFASLQALLAQAAVEAIRNVAGGMAAATAQAGDVESGLRELVGALFGHAPDEPVSLLFSEAYLAATRDEDLRAALGEVADEARVPLAGWLAEHGVPEADATAGVVLATLDGLMLHRTLRPGLTTAEVLPVVLRLVRTDD
ncbi:TetR family transcriptional regulator [Streptomyces sp. ODS28]|uniref:TetR/AcrR family transcriptional regulator n=1 Tax=Streptomyces sp. ODS28 TaxID=3136688 RepID=UPI0031F1C281